MAKRIAITGNTFPVKDEIKALGGRWDGGQKAWMVPEDKATEAQALVAAAPVKARSSSSTASSPTKRRSALCPDCGARTNGYYRCYSCSLEHREGGSRYMGGQSYRTRDGHFVLGDDD